MIADEKYVSLTTRKRDGTTVSSPVWIAALPDGRVGFSTGSVTGKVKRIRNFADVTLQPCDSRGRVVPGSEVVNGRAEIVEGADYEPIRGAIRSKYGVMFTVLTTAGRLWSTIRRRDEESVGIAIELDPVTD